MEYLELPELTVGHTYSCQLYNNAAERIHLKYIGCSEFKDSDENIYSVEGDIRYVLPVTSDK